MRAPVGTKGSGRSLNASLYCTIDSGGIGMLMFWMISRPLA